MIILLINEYSNINNNNVYAQVMITIICILITFIISYLSIYYYY